MKLKVITFVLLSCLFFLLIFGWGKNSGWVDPAAPSVYYLLVLALIIAVLFILSVIRYQRLGRPILRIKSCLNKHLLVTGAYLVIIQAVMNSYHYHNTGAKYVSAFQSDFLRYRLTTGIWLLLAFLQIYNFIRCRSFCRHGLSGPGITVLWSNIEEYHWENRDTLSLTCKNDLLLFKIKTRLRWTIPRGLAGKVDALLFEEVGR